MLGAIAGDVIGSVFEAENHRSKDFPLFSARSTFTDDTVLTVAVAEALLDGRDVADSYRTWHDRYPRAGYGGMFRRWAQARDAGPYGSFGNGSAMRVSPVAWAHHEPDRVLDAARRTAEPTHDHPEGVRGAQAVALAVHLARGGTGRRAIFETLEAHVGYDLDFTLDGIRGHYGFDATCQGSVPQALVAFRESTSFEDAVRGAVSIGGDSDTIACMAGAIAEAHHGGVPPEIEREVRARLDAPLVAVVDRFRERFC